MAMLKDNTPLSIKIKLETIIETLQKFINYFTLGFLFNHKVIL